MSEGYSLRYYNTFKQLLQKEEVVNYNWNAIVCSQETSIIKDGKEAQSRKYFWLLAEDLQAFLLRTPKEDRNFHEVCRDGFPQKFFIDIDYEYRSVRYTENFIAPMFLQPYINLIRQFFIRDKERFSMVKDNLRGIIFQSVSKDRKKISFHIIITGVYFCNIKHHKEFADYIAKNFKAEKRRVNPTLTGKVYTECHIDRQIYKKLFSLRLPGCTKKGKELRIKKFYGWFNIFDGFLRSKRYDGWFLDSLLTYVKNCVRYKISDNSEIKEEAPERILVDVNVPENIMEIYEEFAKKNNMDVMKQRGTNVRGGTVFISLLRNNPSYCIICKRTHHSDNAYLIVNQNGISYSCYRSNEKYYIDKNLEGVKEVVKEVVKKDDDDEPDKIMTELEKRLEKFR